MQNLKIVVIQADVIWENAEQNLKHFDRIINGIESSPDLIVLPEMFNTGFTMNAGKCAETENGKSVSWLKQKAASNNCVFVGSMLIESHCRFYNRMFWVKPDGTIETYDKRHLFRMGQEHLIMAQGMYKRIVKLNNWKINLQICYDLRFPVWSKNNFQNDRYDYDMLIYIANWPEIRNVAYKSLLLARAIENQAFVIWANRIGSDGNRIYHSGDSMVIDPEGNILALAAPGKEEILSIELNRLSLEEYRNKFKVGLDWDKFQLNPNK